MIEALHPLMEKLRDVMEDPRAKKIQSWVEYLSADQVKAKMIHNHAVNFLKKYQDNSKPISSDEIETDAIQVSNFIHGNELNFPPFNQSIYTIKTGLDIGLEKQALREQMREKILEYSKEVLISSLFSVNRLGLQNRLSKTMEMDQIKAVVKCVIDNDHIQMGTGQGKSSTVIPIVSIINSLTSEEKNSLVISINKNLVAELEDKTRNLIEKTNENGRTLRVFVENKSQEEPPVGEKIKVKMMREALKTQKDQEYSSGIQNELFTSYWGEEIDGKEKQARKLFNERDVKPKITFISKDDFVFKVTQGGNDFIKTCPKVFFDEVDAPYIIGETYQTTQEDMYMSPENFRTLATQYVLNRLVLSKINPEEDFEVYKGKGIASEEIKEKLMNVNWKDWADGKATDSDIDKALEASVATIGNFLNFSQAEKFGLRELVLKQMKESIFIGDIHPSEVEGEISPINASITGAADNLADAYHSLNKLYINEGEKIVVRSSYFDQLLENHKFEPDIHLAMMTLVDKFTPINLNPKAAESVQFPTVVSMLGSKLIGFSGTLIQRDLRTGKKQASSLAGLLQKYTGHDVFEVRAPESKKPPPPLIAEDIEQMKKTLIEAIENNKDGKSILILSHYDIKTTREIFSDIVKSNPDSFTVDMLPSIPSDPERLENYYQDLKKKTRDLANGKTKILLSTGSAGIGADIVESSGVFPDLKIGILGLPENESLMRQNLGRRRKQGDDSFWIVDKESLRERATWLDDQTNMVFKSNLTPKKALEQIDKLPFDKADQNLNFILRLIHDAHLTTLTNEDFTIDYDTMFEKSFVVEARQVLTERIKQEYFSGEINWEKDEKSQKKLEELVRIFGLPDTLYNDLTQTQLTLGIQAKNGAEFIVGLNKAIEQQGVIKIKIDEWFDQIKNDVDFVYKRFYGGGKENINQILLTGSPKDVIFESANEIMVHYLENEPRPVEVGYATLPSVTFPKAVPAVKFTQGDQSSVYLIGNVNIGQVRQIKQIYSYEKGGRSYLFTPVPV